MHRDATHIASWSPGTRHQHHHGVQSCLPRGVITGHRAFHRPPPRASPQPGVPHPKLTRSGPSFLGHFEYRKVAVGDCGRSYDNACIHEHSCLRAHCTTDRRTRPPHPDPTQPLARSPSRNPPRYGEAEGLKKSASPAPAASSPRTRSRPSQHHRAPSGYPVSPRPPAAPATHTSPNLARTLTNDTKTGQTLQNEHFQSSEKMSRTLPGLPSWVSAGC